MRLLTWLGAAKTSLEVCVFSITCDELADALLAAHGAFALVYMCGCRMCDWCTTHQQTTQHARNPALAPTPHHRLHPPPARGVRVRIITDNDQALTKVARGWNPSSDLAFRQLV
jgi:hypothetical protein